MVPFLGHFLKLGEYLLYALVFKMISFSIVFHVNLFVVIESPVSFLRCLVFFHVGHLQLMYIFFTLWDVLLAPILMFFYWLAPVFFFF